ncbi:MAG: PilZ domain-containing protein [Planctomycetaceae bacterium]|nr:PilZ domain-containing protein [Planctomycetaceae bacterium]
MCSSVANSASLQAMLLENVRASPIFSGCTRSLVIAMSDKTCQRKVFRIRYPEEARARLTAFGREFEIVDCSEAGLRFRLNGGAAPASQSINGSIRFGAGTSVEISGFVLRSKEDHVAVKFAKSLSPAVIMGEQRWLRDHNARQLAQAGAATAT